MSRADYKLAQRIERLLHEEGMGDDDYYAIIMAAMRMADGNNQAKLRAAWPRVWAELVARYNASDARLPGEPE